MNVLPELGAKFCTIPELFVMPTPLMVNVGAPSGKSIVNALALGLNTMPLTSISVVTKTSVWLERTNVAVSAGPLGTVLGVQLLAVFQSLVTGLAFQVALPAKLLLAVERTSVRIAAMRVERIGSFIAACFSLQAVEG